MRKKEKEKEKNRKKDLSKKTNLEDACKSVDTCNEFLSSISLCIHKKSSIMKVMRVEDE